MWNNKKQQKKRCFPLCQTYKPIIQYYNAKMTKIIYRSDPQVHLTRWQVFVPNKTTFSKYCLTQWISKLSKTLLINFTGLTGIVNAIVYMIEALFTCLGHGPQSLTLVSFITYDHGFVLLCLVLVVFISVKGGLIYFITHTWGRYFIVTETIAYLPSASGVSPKFTDKWADNKPQNKCKEKQSIWFMGCIVMTSAFLNTFNMNSMKHF